MPVYWFVVGSFASWRITHLLHAEDGPWDVLVNFRRALGTGRAGGVLDCFYCLSVWVAVPIAYWIGHSWQERLLLWPALSGAAILLERFSSMTERLVAPLYYEQEQHTDVSQPEARRNLGNERNETNS